MSLHRDSTDTFAHIREGMAAARQGVEQLTAAERGLRDLHTAKRREREQVINGIEPTEVLVSNMRACVDAAAERMAEDYRYTVRAAVSHTIHEESGGGFRRRSPRLPDFTHDGHLTFAQLAGLAPDVVKATLECIIRSVDEPSPGPIASRQTLIDALDQELEELETQHTALVDLAATFDPPIVLQLLDNILQQRETERRRREGWIS